MLFGKSYCLNNLVSFKKAAFTLAEVLITLGIIGIVASMTIPTLVQSYKKKVVESKLVKVTSLMNQAIKMSTIENGDTTTWDTLQSNTDYDRAETWFNKYLADYLKVQKVENVEWGGKSYLGVYLLDSSVLLFDLYIYDVKYFIDIKSLKKTDYQLGKDVFVFRFSPKLMGTSSSWKYAVNTGFVPYAYNWDGTYEGAKHSSLGYGCFDSSISEVSQPGALCTKLIEMNGWKIPEDYPFKF